MIEPSCSAAISAGGSVTNEKTPGDKMLPGASSHFGEAPTHKENLVGRGYRPAARQARQRLRANPIAAVIVFSSTGCVNLASSRPCPTRPLSGLPFSLLWGLAT